MADAHANFAYSLVATAPSPATSGTSLVVTAGQGTRFPAVPFNATIWPVNTIPTPANAEIVRVTARSTDTLTITRAQESTTARTVVVGDQIAATITAKTFTDIENSTVLSSSAIASGSLILTNELLTADTQPAFNIYGNGKQEWGPGGSAAVDTNLYRGGANQLNTDDYFVCGNAIQVASYVEAGITAVAGNYGFITKASGDTQQRLIVKNNGNMEWGSGSAAQDTNLYRSAANVLKTDDLFVGGGGLANAGYGTSLPASPTDGQMYTLVDSTTSPTYTWQLRYNSGSSNTDKWEYIGGAAKETYSSSNVVMNTLTQVGATGYYYPTDATFVIPRAGIYRIQASVGMDANGSGSLMYANIFAGSTVGTTWGVYDMYTDSSLGSAMSVPVQGSTASVSASTRIGVCWNGNTGTNKTRGAVVQITPVRLS